MHKPIRFLKRIALVALLSLSSIAFAEISLSAGVIEQWILSQKALERWGRQNEDTLARYEDQSSQPDNPFLMDAEAMVAPLKKSGLQAQAENLIRQYGFNSMTAWAEATLAITKAAAAIEFENSPEMFDVNKLKAMLEGNKLSDQQKAMLEKAIEHNHAMVESLKSVSEEDKDKVRPFLNKIAALMGSGK